MKVLVFGKNGQVGKELNKTLPSSVQTIFLDRDDCDVSDVKQMEKHIAAYSPDVVINATAWTNVDLAESEKSAAFAINRDSVKHMGEICARLDIRFLHISTDFVFDGKSTDAYEPDDYCNPINVYGASKRAGEEALTNIDNLNYLIVRTAWVYSSEGRNFVNTMLKLMQSREEISVVNNQIGTPTWAKDLARWIWQVCQQASFNNTVHHWTDAGVASWFDFAWYINELGLQEGLLSKRIKINPIPASEYPTPASRPGFSLLNTASAQKVSGITPQHWMANLREMLQELK